MRRQTSPANTPNAAVPTTNLLRINEIRVYQN